MVFLAPGQLEWREVPEPRIQGSEEAIVRPLVMGRCDLDVLYLKGRLPLAAGEPIGHEIIGEIVDLGDDAAKTLSLGQRVIVPAQISCGRCETCRSGFTGRCTAVPFGASYGMGRAGAFGGGVSDLVRVPFAKAMLVPLPANATPAAMIGLADMATDAWRAVGPQLAERPGSSVLVMGGMTPVIGIFAAGLARALGAGHIAYVDATPEHREAARAYGAETFAHIEEIDGRNFEIVVDAAGDGDALLTAISCCAPQARLTSVAPPFMSPQLPLFEMYLKGVTYDVGRPNCRTGHGPALQCWAAHGFEPQRIEPKYFPYADAIAAWINPAIYVAVER
jgi:alcohol dehydrogenase